MGDSGFNSDNNSISGNVDGQRDKILLTTFSLPQFCCEMMRKVVEHFGEEYSFSKKALV